MLYNEKFYSNNSRGSGALEISLHSRKIAKEQASLMAEFQAEATQRKLRPSRFSLAQLLSSLRIF